jgi:spectinomycin phosphotransferase
VREPPTDIDSDDLLAVVRSEWETGVVRVDHVPIGFGAHHWAAYDGDRPVLFVTFDRLGPKRAANDLEEAYAGAVALCHAGLEFVLAPLLSRSGSPIVRFCDGALSCTPWRPGKSGGDLDVVWTRHALARLHAVPAPDRIPSWEPLVPRELAASVGLGLEQPWGPGPYADPARNAVRDRIADLARWTTRYHELATRARGRARGGDPWGAAR